MKEREALKLMLEGAANYIDTLGGDSRKYRQVLAQQSNEQVDVVPLSKYKELEGDRDFLKTALDKVLALSTDILLKQADPSVPTAQPREQKQEPVAILQCQPKHGPVLWHDVTEEESNTDRFHPEFFNFRIVYTTPPQRTWVGLTPEEVKDIQTNMVYRNQAFRKVIEAIEAKLKEKNT